MKISKKSSLKHGYTLLELSITMFFGAALSSAGLMLAGNQADVASRLREQRFILQEAPSINGSLTNILSRASAIRLHNNFNDAINNTNAVLQDGNTLVAAFRNIDNTVAFGIINFETIGTRTSLNYYYHDPAAGAAPTEGNPSWTISRNVNAVDFDLTNGLFQMGLTGPNAELINYTIAPNN